MFAGAIPLIAKIALPLIGNVVQSIFQSPQAEVPKTTAEIQTFGQQLAHQYDVKNMSLSDLEGLANQLYDAGAIDGSQHSAILALKDKIAGLEGTNPDKAHNILFLSNKINHSIQSKGPAHELAQMQETLRIFNGMDALRGAKTNVFA